MTETHTTGSPGSTRFASGINIVLGLWLFLSPWVYGAAWNHDAWNSWIVGIIVAIVAAVRMNSTTRGPNWINMILGIWVFLSPWIFGYTLNTGRFINSLCVGGLVFLLALVSDRATARTPVAHT